jgi:alpha-1,3-mannosyl-glycoprotein beta-1,2-N-acetylglucosaminyltransferase
MFNGGDFVANMLQVSRTYTFGRKGTHMGEGFDRHLGVMQLNTQPVDWKAMDLSYLLQDNYTAR